jgi:hypothetical protein
MASFVSWLKDQEKRDNDPVGWFACFWRDLEGKPRLSSPASIAKHLEDRDLFQSTQYLTEAYDATLSEYRKVRAGIVQAAASEAGVPLPEHQPGTEVQGELELGLAGQAVQNATNAAMEAARAHKARTEAQAPATQHDRIEAMLGVVLRKLERIERVMGLATDEDESPLPAELPWPDWYEQAAVYAMARGPGWDEPESNAAGSVTQ